MEKVSFKVAKAIKEAGYPQVIEYWKYLEDSTYWYYPDGKLEKKGNIPEYIDILKLTVAPHIMEVWLWLWKEKGIYLNTNTQRNGIVCVYLDNTIIHKIKDMKLTDPEEAIMLAIEYLVDNDLIK